MSAHMSFGMRWTNSRRVPVPNAGIPATAAAKNHRAAGFAQMRRPLGGKAFGTARHVAAHSRLADYPQDTTRDKDHIRLLADRIGTYLDGLRQARGIVEQYADTDTVDVLTAAITEFEKHSWFLRASLDGWASVPADCAGQRLSDWLEDDRAHHSNRSASIGSRLAALRAGKNPNTTPTSALKPTESNRTPG